MGKRITTVELDMLSRKTLNLGYVGENEHTQIKFDCTDVLTDYPNATCGMVVQPPHGDQYPVTPTQSGNLFVWEITASDVMYAGNGRVQLTFYNGEEIIRSDIASTKVSPSLEAAGEAPEPIENWMDEANATLSEIDNMTVAASGLAEGATPTATISEVGGHKHIAFGIPQGATGATGATGPAGPAATDAQVTTAVNTWLSSNISNPSSPPLDRSLSTSSSAAPADLVGDLKGAIYDYDSRIVLIENETKEAKNTYIYYDDITVQEGSVCTFKNNSNNASMILYGKVGSTYENLLTTTPQSDMQTFTAEKTYKGIRVYYNNYTYALKFTSTPCLYGVDLVNTAVSEYVNESTSTASATHLKNSYFVYANTLYIATKDIASGGTITPGTNCAKALSRLNDNLCSAKHTYSNVNAMKADEALDTGNLCETLGYSSANDGGGGTYYIRAAASGESGNGGSTHLLSNGKIAELVTKTPNTLNIKQWGAVADGTTDCSSAYTACVSYIKSNYPVTYYNGDNGVGGGTIFFPAGSYKFTSQLEARHYVEVLGENKYTTIITSTATNAFFSSRDDYPDAPEKTGRQNNFRIKNFTFYNCSYAIQLRQCIGTVIEDCQFIGCTMGILLYLTVNVTIRNCLFRACTNGVFLGKMGTGPSTTVLIDRCWFRHCSDAALKVVGTENKCGYQPCSIVDTIFEYNYQALDIEGSETYPTLVSFARCFFEGNTNAGTIVNASVFADIQNFFAPTGAGVNVTVAEYNKTEISNLSNSVGFTVVT